MNSSKYRFTLDMHTAQSQVSLPIVLNDTARKLYISLADGGKIYHIEDGCLAVIRIGRPTGTYIEQFCPVEDNTNIVYDFAQYTNTAIVEGLHKCEVTLYGLDGRIITTARFSMVVSARVVNKDDIEITDEDWTMIDSIAVEEARRQEGFRKAIADVEEAIEGIDEAVKEIAAPEIGENGNWFIGGEDTEVQAQGKSGVYVGSGDMPEGYNVQVDPEGEADPFVLSVNGIKPDENGNVQLDLGSSGGGEGGGANGVSCTHSWNGTVLTVTSASGTSSADLKGDKPVKGIDYNTDADKAEMVALVLAALSTWLGGDY